jgi:hypothetical protein
VPAVVSIFLSGELDLSRHPAYVVGSPTGGVTLTCAILERAPHRSRSKKMEIAIWLWILVAPVVAFVAMSRMDMGKRPPERRL